MTRLEAAAKSMQPVAKALESTILAQAALAAADANDRANGIHRIALDDATVERAAEAVDKFTEDFFRAVVSYSDRADLIRAVLAAAVKEEQA